MQKKKISQEAPGQKLIREMEEAGIHFKIIKVKLTSEEMKSKRQIERDIRKYVMFIEKAHKRAAKSKLGFTKAVSPVCSQPGLFIYLKLGKNN